MEPETFKMAIDDLRNPKFLKSSKFIELQHRANKRGVHPNILAFEVLFNRRMTALGIPVFASEMMRTKERQNQLKAQGHSRARGDQAPHPIGCAVDIIHAIYAWDIPRKAWEVFEHVGKEIIAAHDLKIIWGGDFQSIYDPAHWEMETWRRAEFMPVAGYILKAGNWEPVTD